MTSSVVPTSRPSSWPVTSAGAHSAQCLRIFSKTWPSIWTVLRGPSPLDVEAAAANESGADAAAARAAVVILIIGLVACVEAGSMEAEVLSLGERECERVRFLLSAPLFGAGALRSEERRESQKKKSASTSVALSHSRLLSARKSERPCSFFFVLSFFFYSTMSTSSSRPPTAVTISVAG